MGLLATDAQGHALQGFRLGLIHHAPSQLADSSTCQGPLADYVDLLLHGDQPVPRIETWKDPDRKMHMLAAGSLYESDKADHHTNGCHVIEAVLDRWGRPQRYTVWFRGWAPNGHWYDQDGLYSGTRKGRLTLYLVPPPAERELSEKRVFVAREKELEELAKSVLPENRKPAAICALHGMPGVGKTYLAEEFIARNKSRLRGGYVRLVLEPATQRSPNASGSREVDALLERLAEKLQLSAMGEGLAEEIRRRLVGPLTLVLVENVDSFDAFRLALKLAEKLQGCPLITTGRFRDLGVGAAEWHKVELRVFDENSALRQLAQEWRAPLSAEEEMAQKRLAKVLGYLPLALHLAAGYLRGDVLTVDVFLERLRAAGFDLDPQDPVDAEDRARTILRTTFELSLEELRRQLGTGADRLLEGFAALGNAPATGFGRSLGEAISGLPTRDLQWLLHHARRLSLIETVPQEERAGGAGWRLHPVLAGILLTHEGAEPGRARMGQWFLARLPTLAQEELKTEARHWKELRTETSALVAWLSGVPAAEGLQIIRLGATYASINGPYAAWVELCERVLTHDLSPDERSYLLRALALLMRAIGALEKATQIIEQKVEVDRSRGDRQAVARALAIYADILQDRGLFDDALRILDEAIPLLEHQTGRKA